ncbi:hypothetical protein L3X38_025837 [Prunus dulcis]|uniref:Uncharacterized protein n=1 Tax=Prunus dulcis TaxID=3755 RepID=A0AAD4W2L4_PRUDU|nr:hypothetical protein L3X38_025837 [Prunus dulcis]
MSGITHKNTTKRIGIKFAMLIFVEMNESHTLKDSKCEYQNRGQRSVLMKALDLSNKFREGIEVGIATKTRMQKQIRA